MLGVAPSAVWSIRLECAANLVSVRIVGPAWSRNRGGNSPKLLSTAQPALSFLKLPVLHPVQFGVFKNTYSECLLGLSWPFAHLVLVTTPIHLPMSHKFGIV